MRLFVSGRWYIRTVAQSNAWALRSSKLANFRPGKKLVSTVQKLLSSPALRFGWPISWQTNL